MLVILLTLLKVFADPIRDLDTFYPPEFSYKKFDNIKNGATKEEVVQILGEPFYKENWGKPDSSSQYKEYWQYSKTDKLGYSELNDFVGGNFIRIWFDKDGKVALKSKDVF